MMGFRSTFWVSLIKLASIADAFTLSTNTFCIRAQGTNLCPGDTPVTIGHSFRVHSGFAPYSEQDKLRKPKWNDLFQIDGELGKDHVVFGPDYCLFTKTSSGVRWLGCAEDCHRGGAEPNPWYGRHVADAHPNYGDPIAGQHNRYLASTPNSCPNPNGPLTSQLDDGSGYLAANYIQTTAGEDTTGDSAGDSTTVPSSSPEVLGVQTDSQSQYSPGTLNQAGSGSNALGIKEANALLPGIAPNSPNTANTVSNLFPDTGATGLTNINPLGSTGNTVIGSGATTTFTPSGTGATVPELGTGITTIGTTAGNTNEDLTPRPFNLGTLGGYAPLFRKRYVKSARDFRLFDFTAT